MNAEASAAAHICAADAIDEFLTQLGDPPVSDRHVAAMEENLHGVIYPAFSSLGEVIDQIDELDNRLSAVEATR